MSRSIGMRIKYPPMAECGKLSEKLGLILFKTSWFTVSEGRRVALVVDIPDNLAFHDNMPPQHFVVPYANGPSSITVDRLTSRALISSVYGFARCIDCLKISFRFSEDEHSPHLLSHQIMSPVLTHSILHTYFG